MSTIEFEDFDQLKGVEEGYVVEYKEKWDKNVKDKLPKIIASFANANGGWIFIGISDNRDFVGIVQDGADFSQTIAQLVRCHVTPLPRFWTRYVEKSMAGKGVLVIEIPEGEEPPYIVDGSIYVRVGSSSEKFAKADSNILLDLHRKARSNSQEIKEFCRRTIHYPSTVVKAGIPQCDTPIFNIYVKRLHASRNFAVTIDTVENAKQTMVDAINYHSNLGYKCQHTGNSIIFWILGFNNPDGIFPAIELFYDDSVKISIPLPLFRKGEEVKPIEDLTPVQHFGSSDLIRVVDLTISLHVVLAAYSAVNSYISVRRRRIIDYAVAYEFENTQGAMAFFRNPDYSEYIKRHGIPYFAAIEECTHPFVIDNSLDIRKINLCSSILRTFLESFGIPIISKNEELRTDVEKLLGLEKILSEIFPISS
ncbi:ATP-binding protein [Mobiluncus mulieris]|uniref:ATP-binding protein n=1 Tax=Mobiluncus mulieris TaxID=2052 RepID=UPI001470623F|nr:ATP-binding protein [Mobiluncus mulieris]NMW80913.1 ATP-binding protein [Mobiluncus mulieris]